MAATALLIIHGLVAVALLGAITHQTLATWAGARERPGSFFGRFRAVPSASFANAVVVMYAVSALLGGIVVLLAECLSRVLLNELEIGVITSLLGVPFFCALMRRRMVLEEA